MQEQLNRGIKDIILEYPKVESILNNYNIGCAPCNLGSCLLNDIVEIHNLEPKAEQELMTRIAGVIYPDRKINIPLKKRDKPASQKIKYSPPMKKLVEEHKLIKRLVALVPKIIEGLDLDSEEGRKLVKGAVDFIRNYADRYHHAKEEEILFKYFDENLDIIKTMHSDHELARSHVREILAGLEKRDSELVAGHLDSYRELLTEHIKREDEILYLWMDRQLTDTEVGKLFSAFTEVDRDFGETPAKYGEFIDRIEKSYQ